MKMKSKIYALQGFKVICYLALFAGHTSSLIPFHVPDFGSRVVDIFMISSGFTMTINHHADTYDKPLIVSAIRTYLKKFRNIYPTHMACLVLTLLLVPELKIDRIIFEYSCAVKPQFRKIGNR